jgi:hypothetical protein
MAKSLPYEGQLGFSKCLAGRRALNVSSETTKGGRGGCDVAATELHARLKGKLQVPHLSPLFIPASELETVETSIALDANSVHPGDRMVIDSDKPHWTPTISIAISPSVSGSSHFSSIAPSVVSSTGTLVDTASLNSAMTEHTSCDTYGWEEGHEQKLTLEAQVRQEIPRRTKSLVSKVWGTLPPKLH